MMNLIKILAGIGIVILMFILYPYYAQYAQAYMDLNTAIFANYGKTLDSTETLFFSALPLIGLGLIFWIGYKVISGNWRR
jgi:hypothetical protein